MPLPGVGEVGDGRDMTLEEVGRGEREEGEGVGGWSGWASS